MVVWLLAVCALNARVLLGYMMGINTATLVLYVYDKAAAGGNRYLRVPEQILHGVTLAGGTPGAFTAQRLLSHKTRKSSFQTIFRMIAALQLCVMVLWFLLRK